ncbi:MAG: glycerol-3-phosphate dehydrogenase/oxidase [Actinomycetota bacterium]|nr:glycerol-3-phosphate dehydrogenase/oxidase [Actinomycetota bacterium]
MAARTITPKLRPNVADLVANPAADVLVLGGGINGMATFRELALQGVNVALVERGDYASGASSASSHMIHGGVRYLENGEFRLVNEAVHERNRLLKNAPHYVRPLETTIPIFKTFSGVLSAPLRFLTHKQRTTVERGALLIKVGLVIYDSFSRDGGSVPRHRFLGRTKSLQAMPDLNPTLKYTATYYDASMHNPERLALDVLLDGAAAGGRAANYVEVVGMSGSEVRLRDVASGHEWGMSAKVIVNTTGPWTDLTNDDLGVETRYMGGTKGSHIVLDHPELLEAMKGRELFFENDDGRIVLIYPLKGRVMVGTTDIEADPREPVVCTEEEVDYFFELVHHVLPQIQLDRAQIVYRFSGIRPLPRHDDETPGFVSRDYRIEPAELADGGLLLSLVGGKWTTFRALGEHMANLVLERLGAAHPVSTETLAIGGGAGFPRTAEDRLSWVTAHASKVGAARAEVLLERYGTTAAAIIDSFGDADAPLAHLDGYTTDEIRYLVREEQTVGLADLVYRRTSVAFVGAVTAPLIVELAELAGEVLGWSTAKRAEQIAAITSDLAMLHQVELAPAAKAASR